MVRSCSVPGCKSKTSLHRFPNPIYDSERCQAWIAFVGNKNLLGKTKEQMASYRVCGLHFPDEDKYITTYRGGNLKGHAVPSIYPTHVLNLQHKVLSSNSPAVASHVQRVNATIQPVSAVPEYSITPKKPSPSTSLQTPPILRLGRRINPANQDVTNPKNCIPVAAFQQVSTAQVNSITPKILKPSPSTSIRTPPIVQLGRRINLANQDVTNPKTTIQPVSPAPENSITPGILKPSPSRSLRSPPIAQLGRRINPANQDVSNPKNCIPVAAFQQVSTAQVKSITPKIIETSILKSLLTPPIEIPSKRTDTQTEHDDTTSKKPINIHVGINPNVMSAFANKVENMTDTEKVCILMWGEMSLKPGLSYNVRKDIIEGFEDVGNGPTGRIARQALVFMVSGLNNKWKQPVCHFLTSYGISSEDLKRNIELVVSALQDIGLNVIATVCDQTAANVKAVNDLCKRSKSAALERGEDYRNSVFHVGLKEVVPLWCACHLVKSMRNNLLRNDVVFWDDGKKCIGSWQDLIKVYHMESRLLPANLGFTKLTEEHLNTEKIKMMELRYAVQTLSASVAYVLLMADASGSKHFKDARGTGKFVYLMDEMFDSVNGDKDKASRNKPLLRNITQNSGHMAHWARIQEVFKTMFFLDGEREFRPPSLDRLLMSLENLQYLFNKLWALGFTSVMPRNCCNRDSMYILFNQIRSYDIKYENPTATSFNDKFRTLLLTSYILTKVQSPSVSGKSAAGSNVVDFTKYIDTEFCIKSDNLVRAVPTSVIRQIAKDVQIIIGQCEVCKCELFENADLCSARRVGVDPLLHTGSGFTTIVSAISQICAQYTPIVFRDINKVPHIKKVLKELASQYIAVTSECKVHKAYEFILEDFINDYIRRYVVRLR